MSEFFAMGGYAFYVWTSYGATLAILGALTVSSLIASRRAKADLAQLETRDE